MTTRLYNQLYGKVARAEDDAIDVLEAARALTATSERDAVAIRARSAARRLTHLAETLELEEGQAPAQGRLENRAPDAGTR